MRRFLFQLTIFFCILFLMDRVIARILTENRPSDYGLFLKAKGDFFKQANETDMLIIGDSHIADALDPRIIEDRLGLQAFNLGIYHASPYENYYLTKAALKHLDTLPKVIVLGTNPVMFERPASVGKYTPLILPFVSKIELTYNSIERFDASFFSETFREKYLFSALLNQLKGKIYHPTREVEDVYRGHLKFHNQLSNTDWSAKASPYQSELNLTQIKYFEETIKLATDAGVTVVIIHPPIWKKKMEALQGTQAYQNFEQTIGALVAKYQLSQYPMPVTGNGTEATFEQRSFLNSQHLNYHGSEKFTRDFVTFYE